MRILITGSTGFLGSSLTSKLHFAGFDVTQIYRGEKPSLRNGKFFKADILNTKAITDFLSRQSVPFDTLILCGWNVKNNYWSNPENYQWMHANIEIAHEFLKRKGTHVIFFGTCAECDWSQGLIKPNPSLYLPDSPYGMCKLFTAFSLRSLCDFYGAKLAHCRIFFPFGEKEKPDRLLPMLKEIYAKKVNENRLTVNYEHVRDFIYVEDVSSAICLVIKTQANGIFNVSSNFPVKVGDIIEVLQRKNRLSKVLVKNSVRKANETDTKKMVLGDNKNLIDLGWEPQTSIYDYVESW